MLERKPSLKDKIREEAQKSVEVPVEEVKVVNKKKLSK
jgi:hypothetical protein